MENKKIKEKMIIEKEDQVVTVEEDFSVNTTEGDDGVVLACYVKNTDEVDSK